MEMLHGFLQRPSMLGAVRERSCDADGTEGIQSVSILDDLSFKSTRCFPTVSAEGYRINSSTDLIDQRMIFMFFVSTIVPIRVRIVLLTSRLAGPNKPIKVYLLSWSNLAKIKHLFLSGSPVPL